MSLIGCEPAVAFRIYCDHQTTPETPKRLRGRPCQVVGFFVMYTREDETAEQLHAKVSDDADIATPPGWTELDGKHFCPAHAPNEGDQTRA